MKNIKFLILSLSVACCMSSCLDEDPLYTQNNNIVFSNESNAELALLGCYSYMSTTSAYGQHWQEIPISGSGFGWSQRSGSDGIVSLQSLSSDGLISTTWNAMYKVVSEVNAYLENLESSGLSAEVKNQYSGEAKFLRALAYYNLVSLFGDVPFKTTASTSEGITIGRTPSSEVLAHVIDDLKDAESISKTSTAGRVNSWAVKAFMGKVYYKMAVLGINATENWNNAKNMFDAVYNSGVYQLENNFADLFGDWVSNSKESIFQINFSVTSTNCFNRASNRFSPTSSTTGVNWSTYRATKAAYDMHWSMYPGDPRIAATFLTQHRERSGNNQANPKPQVGDTPSANDPVYYYPYISYKIILDKKLVNGKEVVVYDSIYKNGKGVEPKEFVTRIPYEELENPANPSLSYLENLEAPADADVYEKARIEVLKNLKKSFAENGSQQAWPAHAKLYDQNQQGTASHKNLMVYRYAEMLLLMADVYNELGDKNKAISLANEVLARARRSATTTAPSVEPKDWPTSLTTEQVREKLYFERIIELFGEPDMYEMIRIRGTEYLKKALEYHNNHEFTKASDAYYTAAAQKWTDRIYNDGNLTEDFLKKNLLLPIPDSERDANPGITDNNFGY